MIRPLLAHCFLALLWFQGRATIPRFDDYPAEGEVVKRPVKVVLSSPFQEEFRTRITREAALSPNFAGHFRIAEWGCGSSCVSVALIDLANGAVYDGPFRTLGYGVRRKYEGGEDEFQYRLSSRLVEARGCPQDIRCGTHYYVWSGKGFRQVRFVPGGPVIE